MANPVKKKRPLFSELSKGGSRQNTHWQREIVAKCKHKWHPLSFAFETQLLDERGRVQIRQPNGENGRVYCVCLKCLAHTYYTTAWAGFSLHGPDELEKEDRDGPETNDDEQSENGDSGPDGPEHAQG